MKVTNKSSVDKINSLDQFQFMLFASKDPRLNACDIAVLFEIVDRYIKSDGITYPTGVTHLVRETGRGGKTVKASRAKLLTYHYMQVGEAFKGTTGTCYLPNFAWSAQAAEAVRGELASRRQKKKSGKASGGLPTPTKADNLVGVESTPLGEIEGANVPPLRHLVGVPRPPETYVVPTCTYVGGSIPPALGLAPTQGVAPRLWEIADSRVDVEAGDTWLNLALRNDAGENEEASVCLESNNLARQEAGQRTLERLSIALDRSIEDAKELLGLRVLFDDQGELRPAPANDNHKNLPTELTFSAEITN